MAIYAKDLFSLFDETIWDFGVLNSIEFRQVTNFPIKAVSQEYGIPYTNPFDRYEAYKPFPKSVVLLARHTEISDDYSLYFEYEDILNESPFAKLVFPIYCNYKEASILAGISVRAKNALTWNYKFGFDCKYFAFGVNEKIIGYEKEIDGGWLKFCKNCDDCRVACPVGAIHNEKEPFFLDGRACDDMITYGRHNHPHIPSVKMKWWKEVCPTVPREDIDTITNSETLRKFYRKYPETTARNEQQIENEMFLYFDWPNTGIEYRPGIGLSYDERNPIRTPMCRECQVQPRCNKKFRKVKHEYVEI